MIALPVTSCKFGLGSYLRLVQPKIFSQPEITSPIEIITSNWCHACVLCNKRVVLPWRCHPRSEELWSACLMEEIQEAGCSPCSS